MKRPMKHRRPYDVTGMMERLANPYWSAQHPSKFSLNCEGWYGPGVEFDTRSEVRSAWNIFWAMSHRLNSPKQLVTLNFEPMQKVIAAAISISQIGIDVDGERFSLGQLSLLMGHPEFMALLMREMKQLFECPARELLNGVDPVAVVAFLGKRLETAKG